MNKEAYCSEKISELLKKKGFDVPCTAFWEYELYEYSLYIGGYPMSNSELERELLDGWSAPTHQMARSWLRDVHNIDIDIDAEVGMLGRKVYVPSISTYKPIENTDRVSQHKRGLYYNDDSGVVPAMQYFPSYEEAVEAALKYSLENLI